MKTFDCLRCGTRMNGPQQESIQLGTQGPMGSHLAHLLAGSLTVHIYHCPNCGRLEFFGPGREVEIEPDALPQKDCPGCGLSIDFDYPRCPCCGYDFNRR